MESILLKIRSLYNDMGRGEKKIADWILEHPHDIVHMSISELASVCGCGDATVFRFSKRLELNGYQALKISIAQETVSFPAGCISIGKEDSCFEIFTKRASDISLALENTRNILQPDELENAAKAIACANRIVLFGLGNSAPVALDAQHKFLRAGLNAVAYSDNHMQAIAASHLHPGDVAIGISHSGSSVDIVDALHLSRKEGATTICITSHGLSPIVNESDIHLFTKAEETNYTILAMSSRIVQLTIIDAIYTYIIYHSDESAITAIKETERALQNKKF
jgi:RpiR family carbohydrate utilization transcriptional regulator